MVILICSLSGEGRTPTLTLLSFAELFGVSVTRGSSWTTGTRIPCVTCSSAASGAKSFKIVDYAEFAKKRIVPRHPPPSGNQLPEVRWPLSCTLGQTSKRATIYALASIVLLSRKVPVSSLPASITPVTRIPLSPPIFFRVADGV